MVRQILKVSIVKVVGVRNVVQAGKYRKRVLILHYLADPVNVFRGRLDKVDSWNIRDRLSLVLEKPVGVIRMSIE